MCSLTLDVVLSTVLIDTDEVDRHRQRSFESHDQKCPCWPRLRRIDVMSCCLWRVPGGSRPQHGSLDGIIAKPDRDVRTTVTVGHDIDGGLPLPE